ncbi:TetR/AcrR family transcriptional regulator [Roseateles violae]|uniref:TetR/AcrR family transcriptional regulator n=1 Tax=Roseateles violae TaxID=3058042 RepID=A0ABT8DWS0_9BURK|nr:TetR/AcrR family transcriptional regulator [Pelomonas sp. PFR6]MDN3922503.1 TetR/AcrR family transcriptional regulator [Pelomonas sp. PFR6]
MSLSDIQANPRNAPLKPALEPKRAPLQPRAVETYERILAACAELLGEVGIERLSTNLVCQRAGISPPALYQYFPNKYAILHELSLRLMQQQNRLLQPWAVPATMALPEAEFTHSMAALFLQMQQLTAEMPAGVWVTRAQRAVPALQPQRLRSREVLGEMVLAPFLVAHPRVDAARAQLTIRLAIDALYSAHELLFDEPALDPQAVAQTMAEMVAGQLARLCRAG